MGGAGPQLSERRRRRRRVGQNSGSAAARAEAQKPTGPGRDGAAAAPLRTHALSGPELGPAPPAPPAAPIPAGMMCLECASAAAGGAEEEEADAERRRRRRGAQRGGSGSGCCGTRDAGGAGVVAADDEVQTLSGSVRRAPSGPPSISGTPGCAAAAKGPCAQQPKPASLGRGRGAAAAILSLGNVLNYLDRYTVAGEQVPHPARAPGPFPQGPQGAFGSQATYIQALRGVPTGPLLKHNGVSDAPVLHGSNPHPRPHPGPGIGGASTPGAAGVSSPALDGPSVVLFSASPVSSACLCVLAYAILPAAAAGSWASPLPLTQAVCTSMARQFLPSLAASTPCARAASVCAPCGCAPGRPSVCARGGADVCVRELVSAWLTKAPACGEPREGRGGSAAPGDPGRGLQLALASSLETPPPALWRLGPGAGHRPLGLKRGCFILREYLWESAIGMGLKSPE